MQRLSIEEGEWRIEPDPDGDFVRADEAQAEIDRLRQSVESLRSVIQDLVSAEPLPGDVADDVYRDCLRRAAAMIGMQLIYE